MGSFIDALPVSETDKNKLNALGTCNLFSLLSLIEAAPDDFESLMGSAAARLIETELTKLVPPSQRVLATQSHEFPLGAELSRPPSLRELPYDVALRDRLFTEWQALLKDPATRSGQRAKQLEDQLTALLEG